MLTVHYLTLTLKERGAFKQTRIKPLMSEFKDWLNEKQLTSTPNSSYEKAINYAVNYLPTIMNYLLDARLALDNNRVERAIKPFIIGRNN
jgi:transposase